MLKYIDLGTIIFQLKFMENLRRCINELHMFNPRGAQLWADFLCSDQLNLLKPYIQESIKKAAPSGLQDKECMKCIRGSIFEGIAHLFVRSKLPASMRVLDPFETTHLFHLRNSEKPIIFSKKFPLIMGIGGVTVPDGIVIEKGDDEYKIVELLEYKIIIDQQVLGKQLNVYKSPNYYDNNLKMRGAKSKLDFSECFTEVVPEINNRPIYLNRKKIRIVSMARADLIPKGCIADRVPFSFRAFNQLYEALLCDFS